MMLQIGASYPES